MHSGQQVATVQHEKHWRKAVGQEPSTLARAHNFLMMLGVPQCFSGLFLNHNSGALDLHVLVSDESLQIPRHSDACGIHSCWPLKKLTEPRTWHQWT
jgi:hypothetical protein